MSAEQQWRFNYSLPSQANGPCIELSLAETEALLLSNLRAAKANPKEALWQLARFYSHQGQQAKAIHYLQQVLALEENTEDKAATVLAMGQAMEQAGDYKSAVRYYREAFAFEPVHAHTWYFINNNLGFSLNKLGDFDEGETFCRAAIEIDPLRPNAFKNLGIALRAKGRYRDAAGCFVQATQADASDPRALKLLEEVLQEQPQLEFEFSQQLESCRLAVELAREQRAAVPPPVIQRGWKKKLFLWRARLKAWWRQFRNAK